MSNELMIFNEERMNFIDKVSAMMAQGGITVPDHFRNKPADCFAVAMQAAEWGMNPYSVARKTHVVNGNLGYEAQLLGAVISSSNATVGHFHYETAGDFSQFVFGDKRTEDGLAVRCGAVIAGDTDITWGDWLYMKPITTRNSPLWKTVPSQQLKYLALKYWSRLYTPDVIMGVYDKEELEFSNQPEKDITEAVNSVNDSIDAAAAAEETPEPKKAAAKPRPKAKPKTAAEAKQDIDKADGKVIEGELEPKKTVAEQVDELNEKQVKDVPVKGSAFTELMTKANNIASGKDFKAVKDALVNAHDKEFITGAEANKVKSALIASKAALMAK